MNGLKLALDKIVQTGGAGLLTQQGTTKIIYDTVVAAALTPVALAEFFEDVANKTTLQTNFQGGKLEEKTAMVLKEFIFYMPGAPFSANLLEHAKMTVKIGNFDVIEDYDLINLNPQYNFNWTQGGPSTNRNAYSLRFLTDLVLPPLTDLKVSIRFNIPLESDLILAIKGYAKQVSGTY
jgi:hypothetical protein